MAFFSTFLSFRLVMKGPRTKILSIAKIFVYLR